MESELTVTQSVIRAGDHGGTRRLHLAAPRIRKLPFVPDRTTGSFAGGLAVAYVFLQRAAEITEGNQATSARHCPTSST